MNARAGWLKIVGLVLCSLGGALGACSSAPPKDAAHAPAASAASAAPTAAASAAPTAAASAAPTAVASAERPPDIIIHEADVFGEIQARAGATVHMLSLVATRQPPGPGVKGVLMRGVEDGGNTEWLAIADVTVKKELDGAGKLQLTITDEKKGVLVGGRKVNHFVPGVRVKLHWEY